MICVLYISVTFSVGHGGSEDCDKMVTMLTTTYRYRNDIFIYLYVILTVRPLFQVWNGSLG